MTNVIGNFLANIGRSVLSVLASLGRIAYFAFLSLKAIVTPPFYFREFLRAMGEIGFYSLPVIGLTAIFTGGALALQIYAGGARFNTESVVPFIVALGIFRELGPVLGGLMVAGRISASFAAEIGTMRVTEQIDALSTLSTDPMKYLIAPRIFAGIICMPILVAIFDILGILGGYMVGVSRLGFSGVTYIQNSLELIEPSDITTGLIKAAVFGFLLSLMGCYHGYHSQGGAKGVGRATTMAVVSASISILAMNYILTEFFY